MQAGRLPRACFQVAWQAASAAPPAGARLPRAASLLWGRSAHWQLPRTPRSSALGSLAAALAHLQQREADAPVHAITWHSSAAGCCAPWRASDARCPAAGGLAALLRVLAAEGSTAQRTVLCMSATDVQPQRQAAAIAAAAPEATAYGCQHRAGLLAVPRLLPATHQGVHRAHAQPAPGAAVVTGGLGGLGRLVASWLALQGTGRVLLLARSAHARPPPGLGWVQAASCDVGCAADVQQLWGSLDSCSGPVAAFHAGGVLRDAMLGQQSAASLREVLAPKLQGALQLQRRLLGPRPAQAALFSSIAGLLGSGGQGSYAAANAALDAHAAELQAQASSTLCVLLCRACAHPLALHCLHCWQARTGLPCPWPAELDCWCAGGLGPCRAVGCLGRRGHGCRRRRPAAAPAAPGLWRAHASAWPGSPGRCGGPEQPGLGCEPL